jgi:hypothetical protein
MNPRILERIALYADIDTRRALGMYNKIKIPCLNLGPSCIWRYYPAQHKAIYFNAHPEEYEFEIHEGLVFDGELWSYTEESQVRSTWLTTIKGGDYVHTERGPIPPGLGFGFAQIPEFIIE